MVKQAESRDLDVTGLTQEVYRAAKVLDDVRQKQTLSNEPEHA